MRGPWGSAAGARLPGRAVTVGSSRPGRAAGEACTRRRGSGLASGRRGARAGGSRGHRPRPGHSPRLPGGAIRRFGSASRRSGVPWWAAGTVLRAGERRPRRAGPGARRARRAPPAPHASWSCRTRAVREGCAARTWACFAGAVSKHNRNSGLTSRASQTVPSSGEILQGTRGSCEGDG